MRRDYFTCVFLGLIAGALMFVCFSPLYFIYGGTVPRDFTLLERVMSILYMLFFVFFLPMFAAYRKKIWINWGLAAYGILAWIPKLFYPADSLLAGKDASVIKVAQATVLRGIYAMIQAPFAALSPLFGDEIAAGFVYWILPMAIIWPFLFKILRFYRKAYLSEQLNPMPKPDPAAEAAKAAKEKAPEPEVLGTVISAPVNAASPDEVAVKANNNSGEDGTAAPEAPAAAPASAASGKHSNGSDSIPLGAPAPAPAVAPAPAAVDSGKVAEGALKEGTKKKNLPPVRPVNISAPEAKKDEVIQLGAPSHAPAAAPAAPANDSGVIQLGAPSHVENKDNTL